MRKLRKVALLALTLALAACLSWPAAYAKSEYVNSFTAAYPNTKGTALAACSTCHTSTMQLNAYGSAVSAAKLDFKAIESKDSDGDGWTNGAEIAALTNPGDPQSHPSGSPPGSTGGSSGSSGGSGGTSGQATAPASYRDIAGSPARSAIEALVKAGVLAGGGGYYRPTAPITRVEFASLLQRAFKLPGTMPYLPSFSDVPKTYWAYSTVEAVARGGLMAGQNGKFNPGGQVTRADAARSASIALGHGSEVASLSAADCLAFAAKAGLFASSSGPGTVMTRADAAILLAKVLDAKAKMADPLAGVTNYVIGPDQCAKCHSDVAASYQTTLHSRMVRPLGPGATTANFADPKAPIKASDVLFVIGTNETNYFVGKDFNYLPASWDATTNSWGKRSVSSWLTGCAGCHTTGYDASSKTFVALDITCESCHGPGAKHVAAGGDPSRITASVGNDTCNSCHGGTDRQGGQIATMGHSTSVQDLVKLPYAKDACLECHSASAKLAVESGQPAPTLADFKSGSHQNDTNGVTCVVCHDPHKNANEAQLRVDSEETCTQCHNGELTGDTFAAGATVHHPQKEMWEGVGAFGVPNMPAPKTATCADCHMTNGNHYFQVGTPTITLSVHGKPTNFDSCATCHTGMTAEKIKGLFDAFDARIAALKDKLAQVDAHIANEVSFGRDMSEAKALRDKAFTNISFAEGDASKGIHNPPYTDAMLRAAEDYLDQAMRK